MNETNCKNCGAPVNPDRTACDYCGTRYQPSKNCGAPVTVFLDPYALAKSVTANLLTVNEARRLSGLPEKGSKS